MRLLERGAVGRFAEGFRRNTSARIATTQQLAPDIESSSEGYSRRFIGEAGEMFLERQESIARSLIASLKVRPTSALDVGGGHAQLTALFLSLGLNLTVQGSAEVCRARIRPFEVTHPEQVTFIESLIPGALPMRDRGVELVSAIRLLAHIDRWEDFIDECCRVSSNAVLIDYAPLVSWNLLTPVLFQVKKRIEKNTRPYLLQTDRAVRKAFERNGFSVTKVEREFFLPMGVHRALNSRKLSERLESPVAGLRELFGSPTMLIAERNSRGSATSGR